MTSTTFDPLRHDNSLIARLDMLRTTAGRFPLSLIERSMLKALLPRAFYTGMGKEALPQIASV